MEDKDLILKLKELKHIKPSNTWVLSVKKEILKTAKPQALPSYNTTFSSLSGFMMQKRFAYALASILLIVGGIVGFMKYGIPQNVPSNSVASLASAETDLQNKLKDFKTKSENLAIVSTDTTQTTSYPTALKQAKEATKNLTQAVQKDPELVKSIALDVNNNKTVLDVAGGTKDKELKANADDLYKTIDEQMIKDLEGSTLTQDQQSELVRIKAEFNKKDADYATVLRDILFLNASRDGKSG
jgi:uncharacterized membrane protein YdfJ with MMPL/SSD domain